MEQKGKKEHLALGEKRETQGPKVNKEILEKMGIKELKAKEEREETVVQPGSRDLKESLGQMGKKVC